MMRLSIVQSDQTNRHGLPQQIQIVATSWFRKVGILKAILTLTDQDNYTVYVKSYQPGKGIARLLLAKIDDIFGTLAREKRVVIRDIVTFLDPEAEMKLTSSQT